MLSIAKWKEAKAATLLAAQDAARHSGREAGLKPDMIETLVRGAKAPLVAFHDGFYTHFVGDDARAVRAAGVGGDGPPVDGQAHAIVDLRVWNDVLPKLNEAGHEVSILDLAD